MKVFVETDRLILRELMVSDVAGMLELDSDPEVHRFLGNRPVSDKAEIIKVIEFVRLQYEENGIGRWAIEEKSSNRFVGWTGLKLVKELTNQHINYYDLGYRLIRKFWNKGYASESAMASLNYGFYKLNLDEIFAATPIDNRASQNVLMKLGFQFVETFEWNSEINNWYRIQKPEFGLNRIKH